MRYDEKVVDEVQAASEIVDVVSQYVPLKKAGRNFKGACPFHEEKTPSFMVSIEKQIFHCFGCGVGGNVFSFIMRYENMNFPEALRRLAERAHISLPEPSKQERAQVSEREKIFEVYKIAAQYFHALFNDPQRGKAARDYFYKRGFSEDMAKEFMIGWAPDAWHGLFEFLAKKGFGDSVQLKARLVARSEKGNVYDVFRKRLMFPIFNLQGKVVGFGGRLIGGDEGPKYLNSPEHIIFSKRRELFGLHLAKRHIDREVPRMFVVEGYLDFMRLYQAGFKATVATLGTALTEEHVTMLKRFADEAIVVYDGDKAGESAALRGLEVFLEGGMSVRLIKMPQGLDPDDFISQQGKDAFQALADSAYDFFDFKLEALLKRFKRSDSLGLIKITGDFLETFTKIKSPVLVDRYIRRLAGALGIDENSLRLEYQKLKKKTEASGEDRKEAQPPGGIKTSAGPSIREDVLLISLIMERSDLRSRAFKELAVADFDDAGLGQIFLQMRESDPSTDANQVMAHTLNRIKDEDLKRNLTEASCLQWAEEDKTQAFNDCIHAMKKKRLKMRLEELRRDIAKAERSGDQGLLSGYMGEYQSLLQQMR